MLPLGEWDGGEHSSPKTPSFGPPLPSMNVSGGPAPSTSSVATHDLQPRSLNDGDEPIVTGLSFDLLPDLQPPAPLVAEDPLSRTSSHVDSILPMPRPPSRVSPTLSYFDAPFEEEEETLRYSRRIHPSFDGVAPGVATVNSMQEEIRSEVERPRYRPVMDMVSDPEEVASLLSTDLESVLYVAGETIRSLVVIPSQSQSDSDSDSDSNGPRPLSLRRSDSTLPPRLIQYVRVLAHLPKDRVAIASGHSIFLWHWPTSSILQRLEGHEGSIRDLQYLGGELIASCSWDGTVKIWNFAAGDEVRTLEGHESRSNVMCLTLVGRRLLISGSEDGSIRVWDWTNGSCLRVLGTMKQQSSSGGRRGRKVEVYVGHERSVNCCISVAGAVVATGSEDRSIKLWNVQTGRCLRTLYFHTKDVYCLLIWPIPGVAAMATMGTPPLPQPISSQAIRKYVRSKKSNIAEASDADMDNALNQSDVWFLSGSFDQTVLLWDARTGDCIRKFEGHEAEVICLAKLSPTTFASGANDCHVRVWNILQGTCLRTVAMSGMAVKSMLVVRVKASRNKIASIENRRAPKRIEWMLEESQRRIFCSLEIRFAKSSYYLPKVLVLVRYCDLAPIATVSVADITFLDFSTVSCELDQSLLLSVLCGYDSIFSSAENDEEEVTRNQLQLVDLWVFMKETRNVAGMFVVLDKVASIDNLATLVSLCESACRRFHEDELADLAVLSDVEDDSDEEDEGENELSSATMPFKSAMTLSLFNALSRRTEELVSNEPLLASMRRFCPRPIRGILSGYEPLLPTSHPDFENNMTSLSMKIVKWPRFGAVFDESISMIPRDLYVPLSTLRILCHGEPLNYHASILISKSELFYRLLQNVDFEVVENRILQIVVDDLLGIDEVRFFADYHYGNLDLATIDDPRFLILALTRSCEYHELGLQRLLMTGITRSMQKAFLEDRIELSLLELGYLIDEIPLKSVRDRLVSVWSLRYGMNREVIQRLIDFSCNVRMLVVRNQELSKQEQEKGGEQKI